MLKRKILNELLEWKKSGGFKKKAILLTGLRQCGKTYIVDEFGKQFYKNEIYLNFKLNPDLKKIFGGNLDINKILLDMSAAIPDSKFEAGNTLIFLDEVQECAGARMSLKSFVIDGRFDVVASGSLLGIKNYNRKKGQDIPVGFERRLKMFPLDFEEFLWAKGISNKVIDNLKECLIQKRMISPSIHNSMIRLFKEYLCVGGLPRAINTFLETNNLNEVYKEHMDIIEDYKDDFGKHLNEDEEEIFDKTLYSRILDVLNSIPSQLSKDNKKFQFNLININAKDSLYKEAIEWIEDFGLVKRCFNLRTLELPLEGNKILNNFKLYFQDSGLLISLLGKKAAFEILNGDLGSYKGAIFENIIADGFSKLDRKLYFYKRDSGLEIDFVMEYENSPCLIEVKAKNSKTKSSNFILSNKDEFGPTKLIKFGECNIGEQANKLTVPYYLVFLFKE